MYRPGHPSHVKVSFSEFFLYCHSYCIPGIGYSTAATQRAGFALRDGGRGVSCGGVRSYYRIGVFRYCIGPGRGGLLVPDRGSRGTRTFFRSGDELKRPRDFASSSLFTFVFSTGGGDLPS